MAEFLGILSFLAALVGLILAIVMAAQAQYFVAVSALVETVLIVVVLLVLANVLRLLLVLERRTRPPGLVSPGNP